MKIIDENRTLWNTEGNCSVVDLKTSSFNWIFQMTFYSSLLKPFSWNSSHTGCKIVSNLHYEKPWKDPETYLVNISPSKANKLMCIKSIKSVSIDFSYESQVNYHLILILIKEIY